METTKKVSFVLYTDYYESIKELNSDQRSRLFTAIFEYVIYEKEITLGQAERVIFILIKQQLDRDKKKWHGTCEARAEAGRKGGLTTQANLSKVKQSQANQAENDNENEYVNEYENINTATLVLEHFNKVCKKHLTLTEEREKIINKRLKEGKTFEQLKIAITNFSKDDWEDRKNYCDIVYAIGVRNKIDNFEKWFNYKSTGRRQPSEEDVKDYLNEGKTDEV